MALIHFLSVLNNAYLKDFALKYQSFFVNIIHHKNYLHATSYLI